MRDNPLQFGAVREDPRLERRVISRFGCERFLVIASGGCTALALRGWFDGASVTAVDPNAEQLSHVEAKIEALRRGVSLHTHSKLAERGNFESLFRMLRGFLHDLVLGPGAWHDFFTGHLESADLLTTLRSSPYWPVAFELAFADELLVAMFGPDAIQHASPGSYPEYFRRAFERGLATEDAATNPFLHHVFLGHYLPGSPPDYFRHGRAATRPLALLHGRIEQCDFSTFDFVSLSNVMDWMPTDEAAALLDRVGREARPGTVVLWRQLNNERPLFELLGDRFTHFHELGCSLRARDRSLFYGRIHVCRCN